MMKARILVGRDQNPYRNLAREESLLLQFGEKGPDEVILYLWQNASTVVIGRNQNAWKECLTRSLEEDGVLLARRTTGGGAVFHDLGNLNFSFLLPKEQYDLTRQLGVIGRAVESFGIECGFSGRNDLLSQGKKFSGNAFRFTRFGALHHGTLLVDADFSRMSRYLQPSKEKLAAKGVESVPSRVVNLSSLGSVTVPALIQALKTAFCAEYGSCEIEDADALSYPDFDVFASRNAAWDWNFGGALPFDAQFERRFPWGGVQLRLSLEGGKIARAQVFTDAMDPDFGETLSAALTGCPFVPSEMGRAAACVNEDTALWLSFLAI